MSFLTPWIMPAQGCQAQHRICGSPCPSGETAGVQTGHLEAPEVSKKHYQSAFFMINNSLNSVTCIDWIVQPSKAGTCLIHIHRAHGHGRGLERDLHQPGWEIGRQV